MGKLLPNRPVLSCLLPQCQNHPYETEVYLQVHFYTNLTHFHVKSFAQGIPFWPYSQALAWSTAGYLLALKKSFHEGYHIRQDKLIISTCCITWHLVSLILLKTWDRNSSWVTEKNTNRRTWQCDFVARACQAVTKPLIPSIKSGLWMWRAAWDKEIIIT